MPQQSAQRVSDAITVASKTGGTLLAAGGALTAGSGVAATTAVSNLLINAGIAGATVPVVGWIAAAGVAAAVGTIALVKALRAGKVRRAEAVAQAEALGIPDAAEVPGFVVQALSNGAAWRGKQAAKIVKRVSKDIEKGRTDSKSARKDQSRMTILLTLDALERAQARGTPVPDAPPPMSVPVLRQAYGRGGVAETGLDGETIAGGLLLLVVGGGLVWALTREST